MSLKGRRTYAAAAASVLLALAMLSGQVQFSSEQVDVLLLLLGGAGLAGLRAGVDSK